MKETKGFSQKIKQLTMILLPILISQLSLSAMTFFDTTMSGHAGAVDLAGVAIGANIWMPVFTGLNGVLYAVVPMVSQLLGARKKENIPFVVIQGIYLSLAIGIFVLLCGSVSVTAILNLMGIEPEVLRIALGFLKGIACGVVPFFIYVVLRSFIDALGYTRVTMIITLMAVPINVTLNYLLIFGNFGFPRLGGIGAGYASAITYWCITFISLYVIHRLEPFRQYGIFRNFYPVSLKAWKEQLRIGIPIGFAIFCETSIFAVVSLLMSQFNTATIAAHQAALNFASLVYMLPLSISMALTILVGFEAGAKRPKDARQYSYLGLGSALLLGTACAVLLLLFNGQVAQLYTTDAQVLLLAKEFLVYAAFFQLSDAVGAPIQGILRGYKDVKVTFILAIVSYWIVGLPLGYYLAKYSTLGPFGYWLGQIIGLAFGAVFLFARLLRVQKKEEVRCACNAGKV